MITFICRVARIVTEQVAWSVCLSVGLSVCLSLLFVDHTKTAEPIEMSFSMRTCGVQGTTDRVQISPSGTEHFWFWVDTQIHDHTCPSVDILSDSHGDAASPHQYCGHFLAFRHFLWPTTGYFADWSNFCHVTFIINNHCTAAMTKVKFVGILSLFTLINARLWEWSIQFQYLRNSGKANTHPI